MLKRLVSFKGRAGPGEWWAVTLATGAINLIGAALLALVVVRFIPGEDGWRRAVWYCSALLCAVTLWPIVATNVRRAHDYGSSGLYQGLLAGASVAAWLAFRISPWSVAPSPWWLPDLEDLSGLMLIMLGMWNGMQNGSLEDNRYGPSPKAQTTAEAPAQA